MISKKIRKSVANLSSGNYYYGEFYHFYDMLCQVLRDYGITNIDECPQIYSNEGRGAIGFEGGQVIYTYYRMPSFRWEVICYVA